MDPPKKSPFVLMWVSPAANSTMVNCMYRIIPHKLLYTIVAWLILGVYLGVNSIAQWLQAELRLSSAITPGWMLISALLLRSEEHTYELQSLMRFSYADFCLKKQNTRR